MATVRDLINGALLDRKVIASDETAEAHIVQATYDELLLLWDEWVNDKLLIPGYTHEQFDIATVGAANYYTIGTGGTLNTAWPLSISHIRILNGSYERPVTMLPAEKWADIEFKQSEAFPTFAYYNPQFPLGEIRFDSSTSDAESMRIISLKALDALPALSSATTFQPGINRMIRKNLAVAIGPANSSPDDKELNQAAYVSMKRIKKKNYRPVKAKIDNTFGRGQTFNIKSGQHT